MTHRWLKKTDVIVVTGGSGGLGGQIVTLLAQQGFSVVSLDLKVPSEKSQHDCVLYIECDISDYSEVVRARDIVRTKLGTPTVLINNAGIRRPMNAVVNTSVNDFAATLNVNLLGTFAVTRSLLPGMLDRERGFVVNVASALSMISPAGLSAYGASKAGMMALSESLGEELRLSPGVRSLLVCPGQIDTRMFADVKTPSRLLAPVLSQVRLAEHIVKRVMHGKGGKLYVPLYVSFLPFMRTLPPSVAHAARRLSGVDKAYHSAQKMSFDVPPVTVVKFRKQIGQAKVNRN